MPLEHESKVIRLMGGRRHRSNPEPKATLTPTQRVAFPKGADWPKRLAWLGLVLSFLLIALLAAARKWKICLGGTTISAFCIDSTWRHGFRCHEFHAGGSARPLVRAWCLRIGNLHWAVHRDQ